MMDEDGDAMMDEDGDAMMDEDGDAMMDEDGDAMMDEDGDAMMDEDGDAMMSLTRRDGERRRSPGDWAVLLVALVAPCWTRTADAMMDERRRIQATRRRRPTP